MQLSECSYSDNLWDILPNVLGFVRSVLLLKQISYCILPLLCCMSKRQELEMLQC